MLKLVYDEFVICNLCLFYNKIGFLDICVNEIEI